MTDATAQTHPRVLIVGAGFAGFHAARTASRLLGDHAQVTLLSPVDHFLYLPLLPEVAAGLLDPRRIATSLVSALPAVNLKLGTMQALDLDARRVEYVDPERTHRELHYDRLVLAAGSVNKLLPIPGVAEHAHGFRGAAEALYLRDHVIRQLELAAVTTDIAERTARCTFIVVGAGYTGTEVVAHGQLLTDAMLAAQPGHRLSVRWLLLDTADRVLPGLDRRLARTADRVLRRRGVEVRMGQSVSEATVDGVELSTGEHVATRTLVWCVGVSPDPLIGSLGLQTEQGRVVVDDELAVPGHPEILACGDAAAVPDRTRPGELTAMTAQHAQRQGRLAGANVAARLGHGAARHYRHRDLGFVVDLGGASAAANPLGVPLSGVLAKALTRGYHLLNMPANRLRTLVDWLLDAALGRQLTEFGLLRSGAVPLDATVPSRERSTDR